MKFAAIAILALSATTAVAAPYGVVSKQHDESHEKSIEKRLFRMGGMGGFLGPLSAIFGIGASAAMIKGMYDNKKATERQEKLLAEQNRLAAAAQAQAAAVAPPPGAAPMKN